MKCSCPRLVISTSNFPGTEFSLSHMPSTIGYDDENDVVIKHTSVSGRHARIALEPVTGTYTITDLQSTNGVRVNGHDYGKVQLRGGDFIDLGHVRLRFVLPDEDFDFARDVRITVVPP